ncbi:helix-turn-helix domain-containing protein [Enterococcus sp. AZ072]|uniref:helix-turn-helix domain-containing protein n=1 Tax=unclassified Enterococcus TaxID=2608891 RepID=UPI003D2659A9
MKTWESIQQTINYIEENLGEIITLPDLAAVAHLSPFYFQRLFKKLVGRPVMEYVKLRRLAKSCQLLITTKGKILEIALAVGFNSHAYYTKAFKAAYGMTPEYYRLEKPALNQMLQPDLTMTQVILTENDSFITEDMVLKIQHRNLTEAEYYQGIIGQLIIGNNIPIGGTTGINQANTLWQEFHQLKAELPELFTGNIELGASFLQDSSLDPLALRSSQTFDYFAGGKVKQPKHSALKTWSVEPGDYIVCSFEAENTDEMRNAALAKALSYLLGTWLPRQHLITEAYSLEKYFTAPAEEAAAIEIWVAPLPMP